MSGGSITPADFGAGRRRTPRDVLGDHLTRWRSGDLEGDLVHNYDPSVLTFTPGGSFMGWSGPRALAAELEARVPDGQAVIDSHRVGDGFAVVAWRLVDPTGAFRWQGVDSFFIRKGRIVTQTRQTRETPERDPA